MVANLNSSSFVNENKGFPLKPPTKKILKLWMAKRMFWFQLIEVAQN
jgi:hypothetical protein